MWPSTVATCKWPASYVLQFASGGECSEIDPYLVLDCSQGIESDAIVEFLETSDSRFLSRRNDGATILHLV